MKIRTKAGILFDSIAAEPHQASVAINLVTQDINLVRSDEEGFTGNITGESTWESLQLLLPWDVWLPHATIQQKREVYYARKDEEQQEPRPSRTTATSYGFLTGANTLWEQSLDAEALDGSECSNSRTYYL